MPTRQISPKLTIAILGPADRIVSGIAKSLARARYRVLLANEGEKKPAPSPEKLSSLLAEIKRRMSTADVAVVSSLREASWEADIVIPAVSYDLQAKVAHQIKDVVTGKTVVSVINPLNEACDGLLTAPTTSAAEELAQLLPHSKIVKAFNMIFPVDLGKPLIAGKIVDVFVAGDDHEAVSMVMQFVRDAGFSPIFVGELAMSRTLENMVVLLLSLSARNHFLGPVGWKVVHEPQDRAEHRDTDVLVNPNEIKSNHH